MTQKLLRCIGGPYDGQELKNLPAERVRLPLPGEPAPPDFWTKPLPESVKLVTVTYHKMYTTACDADHNRHTLAFYVLDGLSDADALLKLLDGYRPNSDPVTED